MAEEQSRNGGSAVQVPHVVMGAARLPASAVGDHGGVLMVEVTVDSQNGRVLDVTTTVPLPAYGRLLKRLITGLQLCEVADVAQRLGDYLSGPLLKPTTAALVRAATVADAAAAGR